MDRDEIIGKAIEHARARMASVKPSHGWDHVERVMALAARLALAHGPLPVELR